MSHYANVNPAAAQASQSSQSLEYEFALQRGTQAVIWGLSAVSMKTFCGSMQTQFGAKENDIVYFFTAFHGYEFAHYYPGQ